MSHASETLQTAAILNLVFLISVQMYKRASYKAKHAGTEWRHLETPLPVMMNRCQQRMNVAALLVSWYLPPLCRPHWRVSLPNLKKALARENNVNVPTTLKALGGSIAPHGRRCGYFR